MYCIYLSYSKMVMDMTGRNYDCSFVLDRPMKFEGLINNVADKEAGVISYFQHLAREAGSTVTLTTVFPEPNPLRDMLKVCSELFLEHHRAGQVGYPGVPAAKGVKGEQEHDGLRGKQGKEVPPGPSGPKGVKRAPGYAGRRWSDWSLGKLGTPSAQGYEGEPGGAGRDGAPSTPGIP
jgi:hypothetical protein